MPYNKIRNRVASLVSGYTDFDAFLDTERYDHLLLTGATFRLSARDLLYLFFEVCGEYSISLSVGELEGYVFDSIAEITDLILKKTKTQT